MHLRRKRYAVWPMLQGRLNLTAKLKGNAHNKLRRGDDVEKQENTGLATGALSHLSAGLGRGMAMNEQLKTELIDGKLRVSARRIEILNNKELLFKLKRANEKILLLEQQKTKEKRRLSIVCRFLAKSSCSEIFNVFGGCSSFFDVINVIDGMDK